LRSHKLTVIEQFIADGEGFEKSPP
jgi:hypothetical protein